MGLFGSKGGGGVNPPCVRTWGGEGGGEDRHSLLTRARKTRSTNPKSGYTIGGYEILPLDKDSDKKQNWLILPQFSLQFARITTLENGRGAHCPLAAPLTVSWAYGGMEYKFLWREISVISSWRDLFSVYFVGSRILHFKFILYCTLSLNIKNAGFGLFGSCDDRSWKELRSFVHNCLRSVKHDDLNFENLVTSEAQKLVQRISERAGSYFDPRDDVYVNVANVTTSIMSGKTYDYGDKDFLHFSKLVQAVFEYLTSAAFSYHVPILAMVPTSNNRKGDVAVKKMFEFIAEFIKRHREAHDFSEDDESTNIMEAFLKEQLHRQKTVESRL